MNYTGYPLTESIRSFMYKVYGWMAAGLTLTAATAYVIFSNDAVFRYIFNNSIVLILLFIAQLALVVSLSTLVQRMSTGTAALTFIAYAILNGVTLSSIFFVYSLPSIYLAFGVAAGMFAVMALYGYFAQEDLTTIGSIARMGLFGLIIAMLVNIFLKSTQLEYIISLVGVGVFTILVAYDNQKLKQLGYAMLGQGQETSKVALLGALTLYLDFINLFLYLLRLFGKKRDE